MTLKTTRSTPLRNNKKHIFSEKIQKFYTTHQEAHIFQNHNLSCNTISNKIKPIKHNKKLNAIIKMTLKATQSTNNPPNLQIIVKIIKSKNIIVYWATERTK